MSKPIPTSEMPTSGAAPAAAAESATPASLADLPYHGTPAWVHGMSLGAAVLGPIGLMLPPRRMGMRSLLLAAGAFFGASQLTYDYTGRSLYQRFQTRASQLSSNMDLPESARQPQMAMRAERQRRQQEAERLRASMTAAAATTDTAGRDKGTLHRLWMGNEKEEWVRERARKEKEVLESGGSYWDLITDQITEVWSDLTKPADAAKKSERTKAEQAKK